jgi:hypothetical protein
MEVEKRAAAMTLARDGMRIWMEIRFWGLESWR